MSTIARTYTNTVRRNQRVLYGTWQPGFHIQLGDFGTMQGNIFNRQGNISEIDSLSHFEIKERRDDANDHIMLTSESGVDYHLKARGNGNVSGIADTNASLNIQFSKENSVFFNASGCNYASIENKYQLGQKLLEIHKKERNLWRRDFVLVTDLVIAKKIIVAVSKTKDFSIDLGASAEVENVDLASASLDLKPIGFQSSKGFLYNSDGDTEPLIGLSKIKPAFLFFGREFKTFHEIYPPSMQEAINDQSTLSVEESDELLFSQYTEDLYD